jgi:hypothetical protein
MTADPRPLPTLRAAPWVQRAGRGCFRSSGQPGLLIRPGAGSYYWPDTAWRAARMTAGSSWRSSRASITARRPPAVNDLIDGLMYALIEAVTAGDVQPEQAPEMFGVAALGVAGLPRGRAWQLVRRAASQGHRRRA